MPQSIHSASSASGQQRGRSVRVILLDKEEFLINIENKNTRVLDIFNKTCEHVNLKESNYFGLAQLKDNEFQFISVDVKLQKLAPKIWKSKDFLSDEPLLTFYLRVQYYVDNIGLLKEKTTRQLYYLQLRSNLLNYSQAVSEEKCFLLAAYALLTDYGQYDQDQHQGDYFDPREYFPAWVVMRRGQDYITNNLPSMHQDMSREMSQLDARVGFIKELSTPPIAHNFHFYRLLKRKYDNTSTVWVAVCPKGVDVYEDGNGFKKILSSFQWQDIGKIQCEKKKFEIVTDGTSDRRFVYYATNKEWGKHLLDLCRSTHRLHIELKPRLAEIAHQGQMDHWDEKYVPSETAEFTIDRSQLTTFNGAGNRDGARSANRTAAMMSPRKDLGIQDSESLENDEDSNEIMIVSPPQLSTNSNNITVVTPLMGFTPLNNLLMARTSTPLTAEGLKFRASIERYKSRQPVSNSSSSSSSSLRNQYRPRGSGSNFLSRQSPQLPASSIECLPSTVAKFITSTPSFSTSATRSNSTNHSMAASSFVSSTHQSASPNSSASSGQLVFSLAPSRVVDAASLRQSLPHNTTLHEYLSKICSGEEGENRVTPGRKRSLDCQQFNPVATTTEHVTRSVSLRQPVTGGVSVNIDNKSFETKSQTAEQTFVVSSTAMPLPVDAQIQKLKIAQRMTAISTPVRPSLEPPPVPVYHQVAVGNSSDTPSVVGPQHSTPIRPAVATSRANMSVNSNYHPTSSGHVSNGYLPEVSYQNELIAASQGSNRYHESVQHPGIYADVLSEQSNQPHPRAPPPSYDVLQAARSSPAYVTPQRLPMAKIPQSEKFYHVQPPILYSFPGNRGQDNSISSSYLLSPYNGMQNNIVPSNILQNNVMQSSGMQNNVMQSSGMQNNVMQSSGMQNNVMQSSGMQNNVMQSSGMQNNVMQSSGMQNNVMQSSGMQNNVMQNNVMQSTGMQSSGMQNSGMQNSGMQNNVMQNSGMQNSGMQNGAVGGFNFNGNRDPYNSNKQTVRSFDPAHSSVDTLFSQEQYRPNAMVGNGLTNGGHDPMSFPPNSLHSVHLQNGVARQVSDESNGINNFDQQCPQHTSGGLDIQEKFNILGNSEIPLVKALLGDKTLIANCTCKPPESAKRLSYCQPSSQLNQPGTVVRPVSWHSTNFENAGFTCVDFDDELSRTNNPTENSGAMSNKNRTASRNNLVHHASDIVQRPMNVNRTMLNHYQSNSDTMTANVVSSEC